MVNVIVGINKLDCWLRLVYWTEPFLGEEPNTAIHDLTVFRTPNELYPTLHLLLLSWLHVPPLALRSLDSQYVLLALQHS